MLCETCNCSHFDTPGLRQKYLGKYTIMQPVESNHSKTNETSFQSFLAHLDQPEEVIVSVTDSTMTLNGLVVPLAGHELYRQRFVRDHRRSIVSSRSCCTVSSFRSNDVRQPKPLVLIATSWSASKRSRSRIAPRSIVKSGEGEPAGTIVRDERPASNCCTFAPSTESSLRTLEGHAWLLAFQVPRSG